MGPILDIAGHRNLMVVEDAAQAVNAYYRDRALGSMGDLATFSFHETKNYICGEGGALCVNRPDLIERACVIRDKGTNRQKFIAGEADKYSWIDVGGSYVPSEIVCAFLLGQLEAMHEITERRCEVFRRYQQGLQLLQQREIAQLPHTPAHCRSNCHMFYLVLQDQATRDGLIQHLRNRSIQAVFHYVPLHSAPMGIRFGYRAEDLPLTESISSRLVRLPMYYELRESQQQRVIEEILRYFR
jgi:dTDP-4-amino-4,6-dideoxygalactose transaminase